MYLWSSEQGGEATTEQPDQYGYCMETTVPFLSLYLTPYSSLPDATLKEEKENSSSPAVVESNVEHPTGGLIRGAKV